MNDQRAAGTTSTDAIEMRGVLQREDGSEITKSDFDQLITDFIDWIEDRNLTFGGDWHLIKCK